MKSKKMFVIILSICLMICNFSSISVYASSKFKVTSVLVANYYIKIKHSKVSKANYYNIYRKLGSAKYKKIKSKNKKTTYTDYKVYGKNKVKYKVIAYSKSGKKLKTATSKAVTFNKVSNNDFEKKVVDYINNYRSMSELQTLKVSQDLNKIAKIRAKEITKKFSHTRPDGTIRELIKRYQNRKYYEWGENLQKIIIGEDDNLSYEIFKAWKESPPHNENMLLKQHRYIGISIIKYTDGYYYATLILSGF